MLGETIKDFKIVAKLGRGAMGEVWQAEQQLVKTTVAIKILLADVSTDKQQVQRFFNEAIAVSRIKHAGIVKIFDVGFHDARAFLIMELLEGETLGRRIARTGRLPLSQVVELGRQIASVLEATHDAGVTHRDLKPDNFFIVDDSELPTKERVKVLDFGIAKLGTAGSGTATASSMGTPAYMAPELWNDAATADTPSDIYALGCLVFEMVCGRPPFAAGSIGEACTKHLSEAPPRVKSVLPAAPQELDDLVDCMLAKNAADRPTAGGVRQAFVALATSVKDHGSLDETLASVDRPGVPALRETTLGGAAGERVVRASGKRALVLVAAVGVLGGGAFAGSRLLDRDEEKELDDGTPIAIPSPPALPQRGLDTLSLLRDPKGANVADLKSETLWLAARDDFAEACKQPHAVARWCAGRDIADAQVAVVRSQFAEAIPKLRAAVAADPTWGLAHSALASALVNARDLEGALAEARLAQRHDPSSWFAIAIGARALSAFDRLDDAIVEYRRALRLAPENPVLLSEVALAYHAAGMDAEAERFGGEAFARDRQLSALHLVKAELALEKADGEVALAAADAVLAVAPKSIPGLLARGDALVLLEQETDAFATYRRAIELAAKSPNNRPEPRFDAVKAALAKSKLPPPRPKKQRTTPGEHRNPGGHAKPPRTRPGCSADDPLCGLLK